MKVEFFRHNIDESDIRRVENVLKSIFLTTGDIVQSFEQKLAIYLGSKSVVGVTSCTAALHLCLLAWNIGESDEVITTPMSFCATANAILHAGAIPVFVDVEEETLCLNIELVEKAITPKTKAIMFVNANGRFPKVGIDAFQELSDKYNLVLIEDSAQALGSFYPNGKHMGTVGKVGSFSFSAPKVISTGQGGALITNDDDIAHNIRRLKDFGRSGGGNDIHDTIGYNFKFTDIQAVLGIEQMKKLPSRVDRKKEILLRYKDNLNNVNQVYFFEQNLEFTTPWFIDVFVEDREGLILHLKEKNIGSRMMYPPINKQKAYNVPGEYPVSNMIGVKGLWLPSASQLSDNQIDYICSKIKSFFSKSRN